jgi:hypothetical protein
VLALVLVIAAGVGGDTRAAAPARPTSHAATSATPATALARLAREYWEGSLAADPTFATSLGDRRYDARLADPSPAGIERDRLRLERTLASARAIDARALSAGERENLAALTDDLRDRLDVLSCGFGEWLVDSFHGPQVSLMALPDLAAIETPAQAADYVRRCRVGPYLDGRGEPAGRHGRAPLPRLAGGAQGPGLGGAHPADRRSPHAALAQAHDDGAGAARCSARYRRGARQRPAR